MEPIVNATESVVKPGRVEIVTPDYVEDVPTYPVTGDIPRVNQQLMSPNAVQTRILGNLFTNVPEDPNVVLRGEFENLPANNSVSFLFRVSDPGGRQVFPVPEITWLINGVAYPNATYGFGSTPVFVYNDLSRSNGKDIVTRAAMRNNSGATIVLIEAFCRFRVIANPENPGGAIV